MQVRSRESRVERRPREETGLEGGEEGGGGGEEGEGGS